MKEAKKALYQNAVIPQLIKVREEINRWLTPKYGEKLYIDFDFSVIPELQEEMEKVVGQMSQAWWITPNEKRAAMSYGSDEEKPELDDYYIPTNLVAMGLGDVELDEPQQLNLDVQSIMKRAVDGVHDVFTTIAEARIRAQELGGSGYHETIVNGNTRFMPFNSHEEYEAAIDGRLAEFRIDQEQEDYDEDGQEMYKAESYSNYPQGATNNAKRMIEWKEKYGDEVKGGTQVGWTRANQLAKREALSLDTVKRIHSFLSRHKDNAVIDPKYKGEPWKDAGYVAYNLWGGAAMVSFAKRISENE